MVRKLYEHRSDKLKLLHFTRFYYGDKNRGWDGLGM